MTNIKQHMKSERWDFKRHFRCKFTIPEELEFVKRYKNGETFSSMAGEVGMSRNALWKMVTKVYGVEPYQTSGYPGKFDLDVNMFEHIHNEKAMYALGLIYSDGHISRERERLHFVTTDKEQMSNFKSCLGSTHKHFTVPASKNNKKQYRIAISYEPMIKDLMNYVPKSSKNTKNINKEIANSEYFGHFLRGFFDGDGSVAKEGGQVVFTGNKELMSDLSYIIENRYNLKSSGLNPITSTTYESNKETYHLGYYKIRACKKLFEIMYNNANYCLSRKRDVFVDHFGEI